MSFWETFTFIFINGDVDGAMMCELSNWSVLAYLIPRIEVNDCEDYQNLKSAGIYLLLGRNENNKEAVYIGASENVITSIQNDMKEKDFWNEVMVFTSKDENFYKEHIQYINYKLYVLASSVNRYVLLNESAPQMPTNSNRERARLNKFIKGINQIINTVGIKIFKEIPKELLKEREKEIWRIQTVSGQFANGRQTEKGFFVLKDSVFTSNVEDTFPDYLDGKRDYLIQTGKIQFIDGEDVFVVKKDILFENASQAAIIVLGRWANGMSEWKDMFGRSL